MKLTTKGRYAVTALLDMALQPANQPVNLGEVAERQAISQSYLEQLFAKLRKAGLVTSVRGAQGGYQLAQPPAAISVHAILNAVDDSVDATRCDGQANCQHGVMCLTHELWEDLTQQIGDYLSGINLQQLIDRRAQTQVIQLRPARSPAA